MIYLLSCTTTPQEDSKKEITEIVDNDVQDTQDPPQDTAPPQGFVIAEVRNTNQTRMAQFR